MKITKKQPLRPRGRSEEKRQSTKNAIRDAYINGPQKEVQIIPAKRDMEAETEKRARDFAAYQVNAQVMSLAKEDAIFMHCLPAHRGSEVTDEVMDGAQSVVFDEAENRLHAQKAVLAMLMGKM